VAVILVSYCGSKVFELFQVFEVLFVLRQQRILFGTLNKAGNLSQFYSSRRRAITFWIVVEHRGRLTFQNAPVDASIVREGQVGAVQRFTGRDHSYSAKRVQQVACTAPKIHCATSIVSINGYKSTYWAPIFK